MTSHSKYDLRPLSDAERNRLAQPLTDQERRVLLNQGTEPPFCGTLLNNKHAGEVFTMRISESCATPATA
jgi:peptide-methionine (R)-S-oxide reductase